MRRPLIRRRRNVKIVATLGPATSTYESIKAIYEAGADVFRFNFSHGEHADHAERMEIVRRICEFHADVVQETAASKLMLEPNDPRLKSEVLAPIDWFRALHRRRDLDCSCCSR